MAKNDIVLLDGIVEQRVAESLPSPERDEVFEYLAFEQVLKDYDLSRDEIESGWVDGRDDGGIDGFFTFVNGHLLQDAETFAWPKRNAAIEVFVITAKHHATFQQAPLNNLAATVPEMFDLALATADLKGTYSEDVIAARDLFHTAYRRLAAASPSLSFHFAYVSRGDATEVGENIAARGQQVVSTLESLFSGGQAEFTFVGATELVALYRQTKTFSLSLPFLEYLARAGDSYIVLARLADYAKFVTDEHGHLRRYLFDSNVRDYLGVNTVNEDIGLSLGDATGPEFWWLNNGVTVLATGATVLGKTIQLQDVQIVNGLQTTESVFRHFESGNTASADKGLMVKVIISSDNTVRDQIIRATNNQSLVEPQSLHATDKIQRDIEEILERHDWFYERRKNYYRNIGKPPARFVTPMFVAAGYIAIVLRNPGVAIKVKSKFMRKPAAYAEVFSDQVPLHVWPAIVDVLKRAEQVLETVRPKGSKGDRFLARSRNLLGFLAVARIFGTFNYSVAQLIALDRAQLTDELLRETWDSIQKARRLKRDDGVPSAHVACVGIATQFGIAGIETVGRRTLPGMQQAHKFEVFDVDEDFIQLVHKELPAQPWKPATHTAVARRLNVKPGKVYTAIQMLVARGAWLRQRDGIVYKDGQVVAIDETRVRRRIEVGDTREQFENVNAQTPDKTDHDEASEHRAKQLDPTP